MRAYTEYWVATMIRGLLAIVAGTAILVIPEMASTILLLPFAIVISILCLGTYGMLDSSIVFTTSYMIPHKRPGRFALRVQGVFGILIGLLLFGLVYSRIELNWFLYIAAVQAAMTAVTEFIVARGTSSHHGAKWCYASAVIAGASSVALLLGYRLDPREMAWLIYGYLGVFGLNLFALSARMLFAERQVLHMKHLAEREEK